MKKTRKELSLEIINKYGYTVRKYDHFGGDVIIHINNDYAKRLLVKELRKASKKQLLLLCLKYKGAWKLLLNRNKEE